MKVDRQNLLKILDAVAPGLASKEIIEQTQSFIFTDGRVITYNDMISVSHPVDIGIEGAVRATELHKLLSKVKEDEFEFSVVEGEVHLKGKKTKAGIKLESEVNMELLEEVEAPGDWQKLPKKFMDALSFCLFSASSDMTREVLTCLKVEGSTVVSTDGKRLTEYNLGKVPKKVFPDPVLIPARVVQHLIKYSPKQFSLSQGWAHFKTEDDVVFSCRTVAGEYPIIDNATKQDGDEISITLPESTGEMVQRAEIFAKDEFVQDTMIRVKISKGFLMIKGDGAGGWIKERVKVDYDGDDVQFMIVPHFLLDLLQHISDVKIGTNRMFFEGGDFLHVSTLTAPGVK